MSQEVVRTCLVHELSLNFLTAKRLLRLEMLISRLILGLILSKLQIKLLELLRADHSQELAGNDEVHLHSSLFEQVALRQQNTRFVLAVDKEVLVDVNDVVVSKHDLLLGSLLVRDGVKHDARSTLLCDDDGRPAPVC